PISCPPTQWPCLCPPFIRSSLQPASIIARQSHQYFYKQRRKQVASVVTVLTCASGFAAAAVAVRSTFATSCCSAFRIILEVTPAHLATFSSCFSSALGITGKITFTTSLLCHSDFLILDLQVNDFRA